MYTYICMYVCIHIGVPQHREHQGVHQRHKEANQLNRHPEQGNQLRLLHAPGTTIPTIYYVLQYLLHPERGNQLRLLLAPGTTPTIPTKSCGTDFPAQYF